MADNVFIDGETYRLRAGAPMPIGGADFILQTFMAEKSKVRTYLYTEDLPGSEEFRGQDGPYVSGSFTRLLDKSTDAFTGKKTWSPTFHEEL